MKKTIGILAHVDAGKTTVSEQILYCAHAIRKLGRVDHQDSFMDSDELEKRRGITIFSNQAVFEYHGDTYYLVDTPGHVDFSAEMERAVSVMDFAVVVISAAEGVQGHTETVWRCLCERKIPCAFFINKMDRIGADKDAVRKELIKKFSAEFLTFDHFLENGVIGDELCETLAECDSKLLDLYFEGRQKEEEFYSQVRKAWKNRCFFPCWSGSALLGEGIKEFLDGLAWLSETDYGKKENLPFQGVVSQIRRSADGKRVVFLKVLQGKLCAKDLVRCPGKDESDFLLDKADELRIYNGNRFQTVSEVTAGTLCAAVGLQHAMPGDGIGEKLFHRTFRFKPALAVRVLFDSKIPPQTVFGYFKILEEEDPALGVSWDMRLQEIHIRIMGTIQLEVLQEIVKERFHTEISFGECEILYQETIAALVKGYGHYEPLRHYAEVHLLLEPAPRGSGILFDSACRADDLAPKVQNLIRTHVFEKEHKGILTGSKLTDVKITLIAGKTHLKHTEGGDLREATYRAVRQALEKAENVLLEPYYSFRLEAPEDTAGRILSDITRLHGSFQPPEISEQRVSVSGRGPVSAFLNYPKEFQEFTRGKGSIALTVDGYEPCHNTEEVLARLCYNKDRDMENPSSSVFCAKGAGFPVHWSEVEKYIHLPT